ncbi:hypothetical protein FP828_02840 [bacterium]|nr:hypothetical protein [bacterium]
MTKKNSAKLGFSIAFAALLTSVYLTARSRQSKPKFIVGVRADNTEIMYDSGMKWSDRGVEKEALSIFGERGVSHYASGIKVSPSGSGSFEYALKNFLRGGKSGMVPCAVLYLSDNPGSSQCQDTPPLWSLYSPGEKAAAAGEFVSKTVKDFKSSGLKIKLYSIGCETDYGVCGVFADSFSSGDDARQSKNIQTGAFKIIKAAADAVRENDSGAKIMLSLSRWYDTKRCADYFSEAKKSGIDADYAGLSFYPWRCYENGVSSSTIKNFIKCAEIISAKSGLPVIVTGASYPYSSSRAPRMTEGESEAFPADVLYPISELGQRDWLIDMLAACYESPAIKGFFYSSPEDYTGQGPVRFAESPGVSPAKRGNDYALFSSTGDALAGMDAFKAFKEPVMSAFEYAEKAVSSASPENAAQLNALMDQARFLLRDGSIEEAKFKARLAEYKASE